MAKSKPVFSKKFEHEGKLVFVALPNANHEVMFATAIQECATLGKSGLVLSGQNVIPVEPSHLGKDKGASIAKAFHTNMQNRAYLSVPKAAELQKAAAAHTELGA